MGWIRKNWFWYTHHCIYVEPTEEQKKLYDIEHKKTMTSLAELCVVSSIIRTMCGKY